jgi:hypothetical protein
MDGRLTDSEWERIAEFARTPMHERTPEQLIPEDRDDDVERHGVTDPPVR